MEFSVGFSPMGFTGKASRQIAQHSGGELPVQTTNSPQEWYNRIPPIDGEEKGGGAYDKVLTTIINYDSFFSKYTYEYHELSIKYTYEYHTIMKIVYIFGWSILV